MRKIIFLLLLTISISAYSQTELHIFFSNTIETCDGSGTQSCLNIGVEGMNGSFIDLLITNINDQSDFFQFGVPPETESQINEYCANFTAGATYEIKAIDFQGERESITLQHTFLGCSVIDIDGDTYPANVDCNDRDATIYPGATEVCDRKDNNCNKQIDEGFTQQTYYWDADLDGYGNPNLTKVDCQGGGRYVLQSGDCNDVIGSGEEINPGATEICGDGVDNNCDGNIDEGCGCPDADNDTVCDADDLCPGADDLLDSDNDGTPDCLDNCPNDTNKTDPGACGCGIADTDTDNDGTPDCNDDCPSDPNKTAPGDCGCGTADTDTDSDGIPDCNDACPNDSNKTDPGACGCGVADTDTDNDGTPDCLDNCPNDGNKTEPGACGCGTPDIDTDADGTPDCKDACPNDANKTEPGACGCGVADTDSDGDGTPDCNDACPNDPTNTCNDCPDADNDTVCDADDICPGFDDLADADADGTPDGCDSCPNDTNKIAPGDCGCGVTDTDSDSDGVLDCNDNEINSPCPNNVDASGVSIDSDSDGTPDCLDNCPNDSNKTDPGACGCGVADIDSDSDGTPDCNDACPNDLNKIAPGDCGCGVVETDSDRDGTPDCIDSCPNDRNKTEPGICGCGTSDADKDGDGVPDCIDVCPRGPDTDSDGDGVPDCIDICDGGDDTIDTDSDGLPDCVDTCPNDATNTCTANTCRAGYFEICHAMKNGSFNTLCVTPSQWERHKNHPGDALGSCTPAAAKMASDDKTASTAKTQLNIYPNPLNANGLWIKFSTRESKEKFKATIYDLSGKILAEKVFETNYITDRYFWEFNKTSLDDGVFLLKIEDGTQTYYKRILKLKN